jgi:hypothetical protein
MPDGHRNPTVEDCTSDDNAEIRRSAAEQPPSTKLMPHPFRNNHRDAASDSGYSSHTSNTVSSTSHAQPISSLRPPPPPTTEHATSSHSKPVINRSASQRHQPRPSRSASVSKPSMSCTDKNCGDRDCASKRNGERGYTLPLRQPPQRPQTTQYPVQETATYPQAPNHPYVSVSHGQPTPNYGQQPQSHQHDPSASRSRPTSWVQPPGVPINYQYGMTPQANYNAQHHLLQGSPSAYHRSYLGHHQSASGDWSGIASGSPHDPSGLYMQNHGMPIPPIGQTYRPVMGGHAYSARQAVPTMSGLDSLTPSAERSQPSQPIPSARLRSDIPGSDMPGSFPREPHSFGPASESSSSSESSDSEEEGRRHHVRGPRRRDEERSRASRESEDRRKMPPPMAPREPGGRRPTLMHTRTTPAITGRTQSREPPRRPRHSAPLPLEYVETGRPARPATEKRHTPSYEHDDYHPSVSHHSSSGRTKSGSISHVSRVVQRYIVEDGNGRKTYYDTREEAEAKANRLKQQQQTEEAESYQATRRGNAQPPTLTAEAIKRASTSQHRERKAASHVSGSSRKSTTSSVRTGTESIQITRDGTTFSIPTNTTLQIRQTEEGETWVIGSGSPPREHSYYGGSSKSSGSRVGGRRSERGGGRRDTKTEDDGYEPGL